MGARANNEIQMSMRLRLEESAELFGVCPPSGEVSGFFGCSKAQFLREDPYGTGIRTRKAPRGKIPMAVRCPLPHSLANRPDLCQECEGKEGEGGDESDDGDESDGGGAMSRCEQHLRMVVVRKVRSR